MLPLVVIAQRNAARMNNYLPQMQVIQMKLTEARQSGNELEAARYSQELMLFMREKGVNPLKNMIVPLAQVLYSHVVYFFYKTFLFVDANFHIFFHGIERNGHHASRKLKNWRDILVSGLNTS